MGKAPYCFSCDFSVSIPKPTAKQIEVKKEYEVDGRQVILSGRADALVGGGTIVDWKATFRNIRYDTYATSWQWRCYLDMLGYRTFIYHIFLLKKGQEPNEYLVTDHCDFTMGAYGSMPRDIAEMVKKYARFLIGLENRGLYEIS